MRQLVVGLWALTFSTISCEAATYTLPTNYPTSFKMTHNDSFMPVSMLPQTYTWSTTDGLYHSDVWGVLPADKADYPLTSGLTPPDVASFLYNGVDTPWFAWPAITLSSATPPPQIPGGSITTYEYLTYSNTNALGGFYVDFVSGTPVIRVTSVVQSIFVVNDSTGLTVANSSLDGNSNFTLTNNFSLAAVPVDAPEPASLGILGLGISALMLRRRCHL